MLAIFFSVNELLVHWARRFLEIKVSDKLPYLSQEDKEAQKEGTGQNQNLEPGSSPGANYNMYQEILLFLLKLNCYQSPVQDWEVCLEKELTRTLVVFSVRSLARLKPQLGQIRGLCRLV